MVVAIASYMLGVEPVELSGVTRHHTGVRERFLTDPAASAFQFRPSLPVAILVGPGTGSGAEALAYDLQSLGRACVVGEATLGAAHRVVQFDVGGRFTLTVPAGCVTNPVTGGDWEGTGVVPDVAVPRQKPCPPLARSRRRPWNEVVESPPRSLVPHSGRAAALEPPLAHARAMTVPRCSGTRLPRPRSHGPRTDSRSLVSHLRS